MYLVKFTDKKYVGYAVSGKSIKIGSILHYRSIEDERFRDEDEGDGSIKLIADEIDVELFNKTMAYNGLQLNQGWTIEANNIPIYSDKSPFNALVYSCSLVQDKSEINTLQKRFKTDGVYYIKNPRKFMFSIAKSIEKYIINTYKDAEDSPYRDEDFEQLKIQPFMGQVFYSDKSKDIEVNKRTFISQTVDIKNLFTKPMSFHEEKEFRFMWFLEFGDKLTSFIDETLLVSCVSSALSKNIHRVSSSKFVTNSGQQIQLSFDKSK